MSIVNLRFYFKLINAFVIFFFFFYYFHKTILAKEKKNLIFVRTEKLKFHSLISKTKQKHNVTQIN